MSLRIISPPNFLNTMIFLHGLGETSEGFYEIFKQFDIPGWRVVLPTAPSIPMSINNNEEIPAWFDFKNWKPNNFSL